MFRLGIVTGLALASGLASAQVRINNGASASTGLSLRVGVFLPTSTAGTNIGNEWFAAGIDYKLNATSPTTQMGVLPTYLSLSLDYFGKDDNTAYPLLINYNVKMQNIVYFVGAGVQETQLSGGNSKATTSLALQGGVNYDLVKRPVPVFLQAKYMYSNYEAFRGVGVYVGIRF